MAKFYALFFLCFLLIGRSAAQTPSDSLPRVDSIPALAPVADTVKPVVIRKMIPHPKRDSVLKKDSILTFRTDSIHFSNKKPHALAGKFGFEDMLAENPWFNFFGRPVYFVSTVYRQRSFEDLFYAIVLLLFFFAIVKLLFGKYLANLFTLFFRVSMRQQQIREQVLQAPLPSLLLNLLFVLSGSMYGAFLTAWYHPGAMDHFWIIFSYLLLLLSGVYLIKFLFLKLTGWIFNLKRATDTYLFIVFLTNKVIGIFLLPIIVILSFSGHLVCEIAVTVSEILIGGCLIYRVFAAFGTLRNEIKISFIHYFLYLCAFEIAPLLLIYKVLLSYLEKAY